MPYLKKSENKSVNDNKYLDKKILNDTTSMLQIVADKYVSEKKNRLIAETKCNVAVNEVENLKLQLKDLKLRTELDDRDLSSNTEILSKVGKMLADDNPEEFAEFSRELERHKEEFLRLLRQDI
jgi:hypothetical protein